MEIEQRTPRDILAVDPTDGSPTKMFYHPALAKIASKTIGELQAVCINGRWFEPTDELNSGALDIAWQRAEHANDRALECGIRELLQGVG